GDHTSSGLPLLANDPHLGFSIPAIWYLAHMEAPGLSVAGATLPGIPLIIVGTNGDIAWGVTNTGPDTQDLFIERLAPEDNSHYLTPDGSESF
ncbi:MAG: penicillin acylase family protein, partial [Alphaproteobacteria bacterium]